MEKTFSHKLFRQPLKMIVLALIEYFKYKVVKSIIILACWSPHDQVKFARRISDYGYSATVSCDSSALDYVAGVGLQGVIYFAQYENNMIGKVSRKHSSGYYIWAVIGDEIPKVWKEARYDADMVLIQDSKEDVDNNVPAVYIKDIYFHPKEGASLHPLGHWTKSLGLVFTHDRDRILRRLDLKGYPLRIAAPVGYYSEDWYNGTYVQYVEDETLTEMDAGIRCGYEAAKLVIDSLNATDTIEQALLWGAVVHNSSMILMLKYESADISGGVLRIMLDRLTALDYVMPIWLFRVGFTYLAERESSSNMFVEPFSQGIWLSCFGIAFILAIAQRVTARSQEEKDGSYYAVLATWLQQDASAVPNSLSGRWTFIVHSSCSMLVYAYYTSAIVSALMSSGRSGPDSLRSLADSRYAIASEDYDYMRYFMFSVKTNWDDMEYLKKKKMTSNFYQELERGVELIEEGNTAFHSEYNQIYPHFKSFSDDQICKLSHVDTIPQTMAWISTTINGQWTAVFRSTGTWVHEVGLAKRLQTRLRSLRPPCRSALLAERVKLGDVASLLGLTASSAILSVILLGLEMMFGKRRSGNYVLEDSERQASRTGTFS